VAVGLALAGLLAFWLLDSERERSRTERTGVAAPSSRPPSPDDPAGGVTGRPGASGHAEEPDGEIFDAELRIVLQPRNAGVDLRSFSLERPPGGDPLPVSGGGWTLRRLRRGQSVRFAIHFKPDDFAWSGRERTPPKPGGSRQHYSVELTEQRQRFVVEVDRFAWIEGVLLGPDGEPAAASVSVVSGPMRTRDWSASEFGLRAVPGVPVTVYASGFGAGLDHPIEIPPLEGGQVHRMTLRLKTLPGAVAAVLLDPQGRPAPGVTASVRMKMDGHWPPATTARAGDDGRVRLTGVPPGVGEFRVVPGDDSPYARPLPVAIDLTGARVAKLGTLRLSRGGSIAGVARAGDEVHRGAVHAVPLDERGEPFFLDMRTTRTDEEGRFRIDRLPPASYRVVTSFGKDAGTTRIEVVDGAEVEVSLNAPR